MKYGVKYVWVNDFFSIVHIFPLLLCKSSQLLKKTFNRDSNHFPRFLKRIISWTSSDEITQLTRGNTHQTELMLVEKLEEYHN